jgi:hypothetical protein
VNAWFQGFPLGAKAAEQDGIANWRDINIKLRTPAPLDPTSLGAGGLPGHEAPYVEDAEVIPAPLPAPSSNGPRSDSPSEMPWEDESNEPERVIEPPSVEFNLDSTRAEDSTIAEVEIAARSRMDQTTELLKPKNAQQEFSDEFVNELFGAPVDTENDAGSADLPFIFE